MNTAACGGNKKARLSPRPISHFPPENIWVLLRKTHEKAARLGGNFPKSSVLVAFYDYARTYFTTKC